MNQAFLKASTLSIFLAPALLFAGAPLAQAQTYSTYGTTVYAQPVYSTPSYAQPTSGCIVLTAPMTIGASDYLNGGQVSELQTFLVRDNMLSSAYITGYYGGFTASAVAQFQASRGIAPVGVVGPATRATIQQVSCGTSGIGYVSPSQPVYPTNPLYPINPGGPIQYNYGRPDLNSLSVNYSGGIPVITIQGAGFTPTNNLVYFGNQTIGGVSSNGTQLSFNVPSVVPGNYNIYVTNSYGSSNSLSYTVGNNTGNNNCYILNGVSQCNCVVPTYNTNTSFAYNNCGNSNGSVILSSINGSGTSGATATIYGSGFTTNNNTVYFGNQVISNVYSSNGTSLSFNVPYVSYTNGNSYSVYVTNANGVVSNTIQFYVNGNGTTNNGQISISYLSPTGGNIGTQIAIVGSGFSQYGNVVHFGNGGSMNVSSTNGSTIYFNIPSSIAPCDVNTNGNVCATYAQLVTAGSYPIYVTNQSGINSNTVNFQVFN